MYELVILLSMYAKPSPDGACVIGVISQPYYNLAKEKWEIEHRTITHTAIDDKCPPRNLNDGPAKQAVIAEFPTYQGCMKRVAAIGERDDVKAICRAAALSKSNPTGKTR